MKLARLAAVVVTASLTGCLRKDRVRADALAEGLAQDPDAWFVVDVRSDSEFRGSKGHIPGALHLPWPDGVEAQAHTLSPGPNQTVVLICFTGHRSRWAMDQVRAHVDNPVVDLKGGMIRWWRRGHPVVVE